MSVTLIKTIREFVDVDTLFIKHPSNNNLVVKRNVNAIKQSVMNLLQLRKGDKPFHPEIYSPITDYLFEQGTSALKHIIESEVIKYISTYEPRVEIYSVTIDFPNVNAITCEIVATIVNTKEPLTINVLVDRLR